ncbi:MAG: plasmid mobilization relaxosome protein MobC [Lachnospiraceae bacterium]|nr:plasmid mobilization relaxosome protein MobC [Lachnospiraceae bacterium]
MQKLKNKMIAIRLSENDYKVFKDNAQKLGLSLTDYFVDLLYKQNIKITHIDTKELELELKRQGNNVNQIARKLNEMSICNKEEIEELKNRYLYIQRMLNNIYDKIK